jgi:UDP-glucose 4-epimerase
MDAISREAAEIDAARTSNDGSRIFISGGAGFIGSHLLRRLLTDKGVEKVVIFDNFTSGQESYIAELINDRRLEVVRADLKDLNAVESAMAGCDTVFHLAANPDIANAITQPEIDFWEGTYVTQSALEAMRQTGVTRIFYTSGSGVYGEAPAVDFPENYGPCIPISIYGASKLASESLIPAYCHTFGLYGSSLSSCQRCRPTTDTRSGIRFRSASQGRPNSAANLGDGIQKKATSTSRMFLMRFSL